MRSLSSKRSRQGQWGAVFLGALAVLLVVVGCGGGAGGEEAAAEWKFQKVDPADKLFTLDDFAAAGFKKSKDYNVEGLAQATEAYLGFWGPDASSRKDYELRFYASHEDAAEYGTPLAEEGTGDGMRANKDNQTWQEGAKHRWFSGGTTDISSPGSMQKPGPRFGDFAIYGNVILLCEGAISEQALERCQGLVSALRAGASE